MTRRHENSSGQSILPMWVCLFVGLLGTVSLAVLTPPFQVPDEAQHFDRAYQISEGHFLAEVKNGVAGGMLPSSLSALTMHFLGTDAILAPRVIRPEPLVKTLETRAIQLDAKHREFIDFTGAAAYPPQAYLPQVFGIVLGRLFGAGPLVLLFLSRLLNGLVAVTLLSFAIRIMPFGRSFALVGALLPMGLYEYASASPDASVIAGAFLLTALQLRALTDGMWRLRDVLVAAIAGLVVCSTKPVYAPLLLIAAPAMLVRGQRLNQLLALATILAVAIGGTAFWFGVNVGRIITVQPHANIHAQIDFVEGHPLAFLSAMIVSILAEFGVYMNQMIGRLGWLDVSLPLFTYDVTILGFVLGYLATGREKMRIPFVVPLWWILIFGSAVILTMLAMYIDWSPVGAPAVFGVQGRYYIPILALVAAIVWSLPGPQIGRRVHALLFSAIASIVFLNAIVTIVCVCDAYSVLG